MGCGNSQGANCRFQVHSLTGPVHIEGAQPGDVLKVRILDIAPGPWAHTWISPIGFVSDKIEGPLRVRWRLRKQYARSYPLTATVILDLEMEFETQAHRAASES